MSHEHHWNRSLGLGKSISLVAGNMIGSGVFLLPASLAMIGSISLLAWILTSCGAIVLALIFSRLSQLIPLTGGPYAYVKATFGEFTGFQIAYAYWIALWIGNSALAVALVGYLGIFWPGLDHNPFMQLIASLTALWGLTIINLVGVKQGGTIQVVTTVLKIIPLVAIAIIGLFFVDFHHIGTFNATGKSNLYAIGAAVTLTLWSFIGLESATVPAEHVVNPTKTIPRATVFGTLIAAIIYILGTTVVMGLIPTAELAHSSAPYADAASKIFGSWGRPVMGVAAIITCIGTLNGWILLQGQVPFAAAEDGLFPKSFAKVSKNGTPYIGLLASSILVSILLTLRYGPNLVDVFTFIILMATSITLLPYLFTTFAEMIFYIQNPEKTPKRGLWFRLSLAILGFTYIMWALIGAGPEQAFYVLILFLMGLPFYAWMKWDQSKAAN